MVFLVVLFLIILFYLLNFIAGKIIGRNNNSAFECGILGQEISRNSFSFYFFYLTILFLLFDIELCCLVPLTSLGRSQAPFLLLLIGLRTFVELKDGVLC